jgi:hypothetical protein
MVNDYKAWKQQQQIDKQGNDNQQVIVEMKEDETGNKGQDHQRKQYKTSQTGAKRNVRYAYIDSEEPTAEDNLNQWVLEKLIAINQSTGIVRALATAALILWTPLAMQTTMPRARAWLQETAVHANHALAMVSVAQRKTEHQATDSSKDFKNDTNAFLPWITNPKTQEKLDFIYESLYDIKEIIKIQGGEQHSGPGVTITGGIRLGGRMPGRTSGMWPLPTNIVPSNVSSRRTSDDGGPPGVTGNATSDVVPVSVFDAALQRLPNADPWM